MSRMDFKLAELSTILFALRAAEAAYKVDVRTFVATPRIAEQFAKQAAECRTLIERIECEGGL